MSEHGQMIVGAYMPPTPQPPPAFDPDLVQDHLDAADYLLARALRTIAATPYALDPRVFADVAAAVLHTFEEGSHVHSALLEWTEVYTQAARSSGPPTPVMLPSVAPAADQTPQAVAPIMAAPQASVQQQTQAAAAQQAAQQAIQAALSGAVSVEQAVQGAAELAAGIVAYGIGQAIGMDPQAATQFAQTVSQQVASPAAAEALRITGQHMQQAQQAGAMRAPGAQQALLRDALVFAAGQAASQAAAAAQGSAQQTAQQFRGQEQRMQQTIQQAVQAAQTAAQQQQQQQQAAPAPEAQQTAPTSEPGASRRAVGRGTVIRATRGTRTRR